MTDDSQVKRTLEIEEVTNRYLIHPLSRTCVTAFARWGLSPNAVSLAGMSLGTAAAIAYYHYHAGPAALLGFILMLGWHVMDGADGQLARLTGRTSELGKVLDGVCDYLTFILVYAALALAATPAWGAWAWVAAMAAGLSHAVQASAYEFQRQAYDYWGRGKVDARPQQPAAIRQKLQEKKGIHYLFGVLHWSYVRLQRRVAGGDEGLRARLTAALHHADDEDDRLRLAYRTTYAANVRRWALLCSNYRTVAIFIFCIAGAPALFFLFEIVVLNATFLLLARAKRERNAAFSTWLATSQAPLKESEEPAPVTL